MTGETFLALDFETSDTGSDSACAIGLVRVTDGKIVDAKHYLIRPPRARMMFTQIHGIRWEDVQFEPTFGELWPKLEPWFEGVHYIAAHNASFDRRVLLACCSAYGISLRETPFICTVRLARQVWNLFPTKLPHVCKHLGIALDHHHALSDAQACAQIVMAAHAKYRVADSTPAIDQPPERWPGVPQ